MLSFNPSLRESIDYPRRKPNFQLSYFFDTSVMDPAATRHAVDTILPKRNEVEMTGVERSKREKLLSFALAERRKPLEGRATLTRLLYRELSHQGDEAFSRQVLVIFHGPQNCAVRRKLVSLYQWINRLRRALTPPARFRNFFA
jgi:hypothetical protein